MTIPTKTGILPESEVRQMFDSISRFYDRMNKAMTAGMDRRWRLRAAELAAVHLGDQVLDVATGTGDLAIELSGRIGPNGLVIGCDFSEQMLALARAKAPSIRFDNENALNLSYPSSFYDAVTVGFGVRNFEDLDRGLSEMVRVVKPGGRVVILEITTPDRAPLSIFFELWFERIVPLLGQIAGASSAYDYLPRSVKRFPDAFALASRMAAAGLSDISWVKTAGGIIALHVGTKPNSCV